MVHPHKLLAIAKVVEYKNITYAAKALHMTQPAVTNIIRQLERHFGQPLVRGEGKQLMITDAAYFLVNSWRRLESTYEDLHQAMHAHEQGDVGLIRLKMVSTGKYLMPKILTAFQKKYSKVEFACQIQHRELLISSIKNHEADLAIITNPAHDNKITAIKLGNNPLGFVINSQHRLAEKSNVSLQDLMQEKFIIREKSALITQCLFEIFSQKKAVPQIGFEIDSTEAIKESLLSGNNVALLPLACIKRELSHGLLCTVNVRKKLESLLTKQHWHIIKHKDYPLNTISQKFLTMLLEKFN